jgi:hypothetical protein
MRTNGRNRGNVHALTELIATLTVIILPIALVASTWATFPFPPSELVVSRWETNLSGTPPPAVSDGTPVSIQSKENNPATPMNGPNTPAKRDDHVAEVSMAPGWNLSAALAARVQGMADTNPGRRGTVRR